MSKIKMKTFIKKNEVEISEDQKNIDKYRLKNIISKNVNSTEIKITLINQSKTIIRYF